MQKLAIALLYSALFKHCKCYFPSPLQAWQFSSPLQTTVSVLPKIFGSAKLQQLCRDDRAMIRWICGTKDSGETPSVSPLQKLGIEDITAVLCSRRFRSFQICHILTEPRHYKTRRPRKSWSECVKTDARECVLSGVDPQDRERHGELVPDVTWCYRPHWMEHGQHPNLKMDMDGMGAGWPAYVTVSNLDVWMETGQDVCH